MKIENTQGIKRIEMFPKAKCFCPLGNDWYTNNFTVEFYPKEYFPDYCDVLRFIDENIDGKELIIEDAVRLLYEHLLTYEPLKIIITSSIDDAKSHFPVRVTK